MILEVIIKYWVQWVCILITGVVSFLAKRYVKLEKERINLHQKEQMQELRNEIVKELEKDIKTEINSLKEEEEEIMLESREEDKQIEQRLDGLEINVNGLSCGVLSLQGREFKKHCYELLEKNHEITLEEWSDISKDHEAYNGLGGNHRGDELFEMVKKKFENTITKI